MRKVDLRMNELDKYNTIKDVVHKKKTKERAIETENQFLLFLKKQKI